MDDNTTADRPAAPTGGPSRRRRALAGAALLLSVSVAVSACGGSGSTKSAASGASGSPSASASASASSSASASGSPSTAPSAGASASSSAAAGGGTGGAAPTQAPGGNPSAPVKSPEPGGSENPVDPIHPPAAFKPDSYLANGNQLTVFFTAGICNKFGLKIDEKPGGPVGVDVVITQPAPVGRMCPDLSKRQSVVGTLAQPLNGRSVVSLRDNSPVPLESAPGGGPVSAAN